MCVIVQHFGKPANLPCRLACTHKEQKGKWSTRHQQRLPLSISLSDLQFRPPWFFSVFYKVPPAFAFRALNLARVMVIYYNLILLFFSLIKYMTLSYIPNAISKCIFMISKSNIPQIQSGHIWSWNHCECLTSSNSILHYTLKWKCLYWPLHLLVVLSRIAFADWILPYLSTTKYALLSNSTENHKMCWACCQPILYI